MKGEERRKQLLNILSSSTGPVSGGTLSQELHVSRQIIVQDISLLRANGSTIFSTNKGYLLQEEKYYSRVFKVYHTEAQVEELLKQQTPAFLSLGQVLLDEGVLTNTDFEQIIQDYRSKNGMEDEESLIERRKNIQQLFENFFSSTDAALSEKGHMFIELLFNDFIRFIGSDYTPLSVEEVTEASIACCVKQEIHGDYAINTYISMDLDTAIAFATRYVHEQFHSYDEYVQASLEDFLNLQNGLFIVNVSNTSNTELTLGAPEHITVSPIQFSGRTLHIPVLYTFGTIDFYMERVSIKE